MAQFYKLDKVKELAGGDDSFIIVLVQTFLDEIPADLKNMEDSVESGDAALAYQFAHKMKPSFQLFEIEVLNYIKLLESWSQGAINKDEAGLALSTILEKANAAINEMQNDF